MTAADAPDKGATQAAAGWFVVGAYLLLGGVGIVIAAMAVGFESVLTSRTKPKGEGWAQTLADQRAWLAQDTATRRRWRESRRAWWESGADPADRPERPSGPARFGAWLRRTVARLILAGDATVRAGGRFAAGFRRGWTAAREARGQGAGFRETIRAGRTVESAEPTTDTPTETEPESGPAVSDQPIPAAVRKPSPRPQPDPAPAVPAQSTEPQPAPHQEESTVTAALGETPAQITAQLIEEIRQQLSRVNDLNDHLAAANNTLAVQVSQTQDYVTANGGTTETAAALDAAGGVVREIGSHVGSASDAVAKAADSALAADAGLRPAQDAEDQLTAAGADGRFVAPATSD